MQDTEVSIKVKKRFVLKRRSLAFGLAFASLPARAAASADYTPTRGWQDTATYVGSGILGTVVGFGTGHAVQGRYLPMGATFTAIETAGLFLMLRYVPETSGDGDDHGHDDDDFDFVAANDATLFWAGFTLFFGGKIWEIVNVWSRPEGPAPGDENQASLSLGLAPVDRDGGRPQPVLKFHFVL